MDIIKSDRTPRKWEWVAKQLKNHEGTEKLIEMALEIDMHMKTLYGEHTHSSQWILDMRVWQNCSARRTILDMFSKSRNCTACSYADNVCVSCEFMKLGNMCRRDNSLFRNFLEEFFEVMYGGDDPRE